MTLLMTLFFFVASLVPLSKVAAQTANDYYQNAVKAYEEKNYPAYLQDLQKALELGVNHPVIYYNLAGAYALNGKPKEAVQWLNQLADLGLSFAKATEEPGFESIRNSPEFRAVLKRFQQNETPTNNSVVGFTIPQNDLITEGIAYDAVDRKFYVSSIRHRKIVMIDQKGKVSDFATKADGLWSVLGMSIDPKRRILWASSTAFPEMIEYQESDKGRSGIFAYDLKTGKLIGKYLISDTTSEHGLGDVIVDSSGVAYTTDSTTPALYRVNREKGVLEFLLGGTDVFRSPQGLAFSPDEKHLFVADYSRGIFVIDPSTWKYTKLQPPPRATVVGIDGLYFYHNSLIATQNGVEPNRVLRIELNPAFDQITGVKVLESNHKLFDEPTLGVIANDQLFFIANNQYGAYAKDPKAALNPPIILKLKLQ